MPRLTMLTLWFINALLCGSILAANTPPTIQSLNKMPLSFTKNMGQWDERVLFRANAGGATMWFTKEGVTYQFTRNVASPVGAALAAARDSGPSAATAGDRKGRPYNPDDRDSIEQLVLTAKFVGANANPEVVGQGQLEYKCNYFLGNDPSKWHTDVPNYEAITLKDIYPGINLKYSGYDNGQAAYEFIAAPGADIALIKIEYDGAEQTSIDADGRLVVRTTWGDMVAAIKSPTNGALSGTAGLSQLSEKPIGFEANGASRQALGTLSVGLVYSTYLGGSGEDIGNGIAVDGNGNAYVRGETASSNFPILNPYQTDQGSRDIFVTKFSSSGSLIYSTYLGGSGGDWAYGIAVDGSGNAYVTGSTGSLDFPTQNPYQGTNQGHPENVFVTKLSSSGNSLIYSTYLGGGEGDYGWAIAVDGSGDAYVTGGTTSPDFPTVNPYQEFYQGCWYCSDAFVTKLSSSGNSLIYSTYLGGGSYDHGAGIAVDGSGNAYVTGYTDSPDFPTTPSGYDPTYNGGRDAFVAKFSSAGAMMYSTYLGGESDDEGRGIAVDGSRNAYVTGTTGSTIFPTMNAYQATFQGGSYYPKDAFVTKLYSSGDSLIYSTYLGGANDDEGYGIAVDGSGNAYVAGSTWSSDFPILDAYQTFQGSWDVFVTKLSSFGNSLINSTYLGGSSTDQGYGIAVDGSGNAYVTGETWSSDFPTLNPYQGTFQGGGTYGGDAFVTKLSFRSFCDGSTGLFCDDFDQGVKPDWSQIEGSCVWQNTGGCWQTSATGSQVYCIQNVGNSTWRNYNFEVLVNGTGGVDKVVNFRLQDATHWYGLNLRSSDGKLLLTKRTDSGLPALLTEVNWPNSNNVWYDLKVSCMDSTIYVSVDNSPAITYTDHSTPFLSGGVGITCYTGAFGSCDISFDNVRVSGLVSGDADHSGGVDISDAVFCISYIFSGGAAPDPLPLGDANCDGMVDISDAVYLIAYIFSGGAAPCGGK
jgi:hypothetical protein